MTLNTPGASAWPARFAYGAAALFSAASGITNLLYGIAKGTDFGTSLVWGTVSVAVSVVFALSWPAVILSADRKQWSRAAMALIALLLTGTYSVSAALGSAMGGRANAAIEQKDISDKRAKAQASYDGATTELTALKPSRPVAEVEALVESARPQCRIVVTLNRRDTVCAKPAALTAELGRAKRRAELEQKIERARTELANSGPAKLANSDAVALATYLQGLGLPIDAERMNKLLVLLAVLIIECGGGLALAVGMALGDKAFAAQTVHRGTVHSNAPPIKEMPAAPIEITPAHTVHSPTLSARDRLLQMVRDDKGVLRTGHRALGEALGISATRAGQLLKQLAEDGAIRVRAGKTGTVVTLAPRLVGASGHA
jgi:hypothetical protein